MTANLSKVHNLAWRKFLTAHTVLIDQIEQDLAAADLPPLGWYDVLFALSQASEHKLRLHELAQAVLLSRSNITRLVDRLESKGLLQREQCSRDRRGAFAVITQAGFAMLERMWTVYESAITRDFACHLNVADVKLFIKSSTRSQAAQIQNLKTDIQQTAVWLGRLRALNLYLIGILFILLPSSLCLLL